MRRAHGISSVLAAAGLLAVASPLAGQNGRAADDAARPPITWCEKPAENPEWARRIAYLTIGPSKPDSASALRVLRQAFPFILAGIAAHFVADQQPGRSPDAQTLEDLPRGDPRYGPVDIFSGVRFDLLGSGVIDSVTTYGRKGAVIREDLMSALLAAIAGGRVFGPYGDSTARTTLFVGLLTDSVRGTARWPAFTVEIPLSRPARPDPRNRLEYPPRALGWRGALQYTFEIDEDGRVVPESIRNLVPPDEVKWDTHQRRRVYESFIRTVEVGLSRFRYAPAEYFGCRERSSVRQAFQFEMAY